MELFGHGVLESPLTVHAAKKATIKEDRMWKEHLSGTNDSAESKERVCSPENQIPGPGDLLRAASKCRCPRRTRISADYAESRKGLRDLHLPLSGPEKPR